MSTRIPESDLLRYEQYYEMAKTTPLISYLFFFGKDPLYFSITYCFSSLDIPFSSYLFILGFFYGAMYIIISRKIAGSNWVIFFFLLLTNSYFISISFHLIRQYVALLVLIYVLFKKNPKNFEILIPGLIHYSFFAYAILFFLNRVFKGNINYREILIIMLLSPLLLSESFQLLFSYGLKRMSGELLNFGSPSVGSILFLFLSVVTFIYKHKTGIYGLVFGFTLLVAIFAVFVNTELFFRTFPVLYVFSAIEIYMYLRSKELGRLLIGLQFILTIYLMLHGKWHYGVLV